MQYNFIIIRTEKGKKYANKILNSIKWINEHKYPNDNFITLDFTISEFLALGVRNFKQTYGVNNTLIHARCANPRTEWTESLRELEESGYKVINSVDTIELTSNKLACSLHLQGKVNHPKSWEYVKNNPQESKMEIISDVIDKLNLKYWTNDKYFIAKPLTSLEQGANVRKINIENFWDVGAEFFRYEELVDEVDKVPGNKIVIQEYIPYTALHRVIVIGGKALPYTFIDKPEWHQNGDWKVSCCLNRTTMQIDETPPLRLLQLAEQTQREVGGVINFIDIFEYPWGENYNRIRDMYGNFTNAEINTACSLNIHESLAKQAGRQDWNIHYRIAKQLVKELIGE